MDKLYSTIDFLKAKIEERNVLLNLKKTSLTTTIRKAKRTSLTTTIRKAKRIMSIKALVTKTNQWKIIL